MRAAPPTPGMMPKPVSGKPIEALALTVRTSAASASSAPPPSAAPSMAARTGTGSAAKPAMTSRTLSLKRMMSAGCCSLLSFRSAPAQNAPADRI